MQMIEGLTYLLVTDPRGGDSVASYGRNEIDELFSDEEQKAMALGGSVTQEGRFGPLRYIDMVAAARTVR